MSQIGNGASPRGAGVNAGQLSQLPPEANSDLSFSVERSGQALAILVSTQLYVKRENCFKCFLFFLHSHLHSDDNHFSRLYLYLCTKVTQVSLSVSQIKMKDEFISDKMCLCLSTYSGLVRQDVTNPSSDNLGFFFLLWCIIKPVGAWNKSATLQNTLLNTMQKRVCFACVCELSVSVLELMKEELKAYPLLQQWKPPCHHLLPSYHFFPPSHILFFFFPLLL